MTILNLLKSVGLKLVADWWESRGKDRLGDLKDEIIQYVEDRVDIVEKELKASYGIRETVRDHVVLRDQVTHKSYKIFIANAQIKSEIFHEDN